MAPRPPADIVSRSDADACVYRDLRSHRRPDNRHAKQSAKYYGYRGVHPSWIGQPYFDITTGSQDPDRESEWAYQYPNLHASMDPLLLAEANGTAVPKIATWTKRDMWQDRENGIWPLDRRHHVGKRIREKRCRKWNELAMGRRMRQRSREWGFVVEDARDMARLRYDDVDTVYWELDDVDVEEVYNERGEPPPEWIYLDGERFFDAWFENGVGGYWEESDGVVEVEDCSLAVQEQDDLNFIWLRSVERAGKDSEEDDYCFVYRHEGRDDMSNYAGEDCDFEMIELWTGVR
ncbi:hypothetical protein A1O7_07670 [Cladophialophora yegresii CBS 114405]|uniref:Uncharacterized protein n=1 Tax=Cladophialophora yegresii CBS 114405 TaxID=1182544 RepID=W9VP48_9EURO|nr:uncharacterized protein A1O7_07670 [Cladophialophora yegresii CBS 114405]EXJ57323.1 hypothetical protein A1O7_07670 [Cladophialophora yegresii CBS 114405]